MLICLGVLFLCNVRSVKPLLCVVLIFIYYDLLPFVMHFTGGDNLVQIIINSTFREQ